jgi:hypothetical protein
MIKWTCIAKPKNKVGLAVKDLETMNISLLLKWWWQVENKKACGRR